MYYHINKANLTIIKGPISIQDPYIKVLTSCGNPEALDLTPFDLVPLVKSPLGENQRYSNRVIVFPDKVEIEIEDIPELELMIIAREIFKANRQEMVDNIKVTTTQGNTFDGDETSQTRMSRAITALADDTETILWVLANNTPIFTNRVELKEALRLAGRAQEAIWVMP